MHELSTLIDLVAIFTSDICQWERSICIFVQACDDKFPLNLTNFVYAASKRKVNEPLTMYVKIGQTISTQQMPCDGSSIVFVVYDKAHSINIMFSLFAFQSTAK